MANDIQYFIKESAFEEALTNHLLQNGWNEVIMNPSEEDLINNWAKIIYDNNRGINQLGNFPLTNTEMQQIVSKVNFCQNPYEVNNLINSKTICITRDNEQDTNNFGKEVYLKIFDPKEISSGQSRYQIARQPKLKTSDQMKGDRRGDMMLLINGMPVIHIELKRSKVDVSQAAYQIKRYTHEGVFSNGIFKMIQIFVAMTPEETLYFANPGSVDKFSPQFYFHWQDFNNTVINDWQKVATDLLSIPMAHQLIGYYTIADDKDKTLKVLRSYQYYAAAKISDVVHRTNWDDHQHRGGYVWHTTGSGKTMTSFKSAQLIAESGDADKVVFLLDRIELSVQSLDEYRGFAGNPDDVNDTADTGILISKLKSPDKDDTLIVTSIQKMANIRGDKGIDEATLNKIRNKKLVFIIDECHRSVFGEMLISIKHTFPRAILFGFTGTPVFVENAHNEITTETLFGDMLHKYTIANGIPDKNVLGFDPYMVRTYQDDELRELVAFHEINKKIKDDPAYAGREIKCLDDIEGNEDLMKIYDKFVNQLQMPMSYTDESGKSAKGIDGYLPKNIYKCRKHYLRVAENIIANRPQLSKEGKFHAILATKSIPEAIEYYHIFKELYPSYNVVAVFDNNIDNSDEGMAKEDSIIEMLKDYNAKYGTSFQLSNYAKYKKDVAKRLAHKKPYIGIENDHNKQIDLLIVVTQMLTGYDSKWVNTLYVDKLMKYVDVIQAFSRTNRLFGPDKPFGIIKYYAYPYTMEQYINDALEVYVDRPLGVFVDKLETNLQHINSLFNHIREIFKSQDIHNFEHLPNSREDRNMFAKDFSKMTHLLEAAKLQGFVWDKDTYEFKHGDTYVNVKMELDERTYLILLQRYRELFTETGGGEKEDWEYDIDTYITETGTGTIDAEYINSKFVKFIKNLYTEGAGSELTKKALQELHVSFASLSQTDQRTAVVILHDIQRGDLKLEFGKTIYDYIAEYQVDELHQQILTIAEATGLNSSQLINILANDANEANLNEFNRFENLKSSLDLVKTKAFLSKVYGTDMPARRVMIKADEILRKFILEPASRELIIAAYVNEDVTIDTATVPQATTPDNIEDILDTPQEDVVLDIDKIKASVKDILKVTLCDVIGGMRPYEEVVNSVFDVLGKQSLQTLDNVGLFISKAFADLFVKDATIVDKHVGFNLLVTKFEAYLKKLYYLIHNEEVKPQYEGEDVTWKNVIHGFPCLWDLKYSREPKFQMLYQYLEMVKAWRNNESHISPTATEQEINLGINIIITMYFYATGCNITELESAEGFDSNVVNIPTLRQYRSIEDNCDSLAAEP